MLAVTLLAARPARASDEPPPAWPVRVNVSMPLGNTWGREKLHGFTWGFRGSLVAYPTAEGHGVGLGGFAEISIDAATHSMGTFGALGSVPFARTWLLDWRVSGYAGVRRSGEGTDDARRLALGIVPQICLPAYLYDVQLGLRLDGTFDGHGMSATALLLEVDLAVLLAAFAGAGLK